MSGPRKIGNIDRFSILPDEIGHKIVGYIAPEDISRLSVVSKRCRQLGLSTPFLHVDADPFQHNFIKLAQLMNCVDRHLFLRQSSHIPCCKISWTRLTTEEQEYRLLSWLHKIVLCDVNKLELFVSSLKQGSDFTLPSSIFSCKSLESLDAVFDEGYCNIKIPSNVGFSSLKILTLYRVGIDPSFFYWISRCCICLEDLRLVDTKGTKNITIASPSLKALTLLYPSVAVHLQVYAEKLQEISLILLTDNTPQWTEPKFIIPNIHTFHKLLLNKTPTYRDLHELRNKSFPDLSHCLRVVACLQNFSTTLRCLRIFGDTIHLMSNWLFPTPLPTELPNVTEITLWMTHHNVEIVSPMSSFLNRTPNLQHLTIQADDEPDVNGGVNIQQGVDLKNYIKLSFLKDVKFVNGPVNIQQGVDSKNFPILSFLKDVKFIFPLSVEKSELELIEYLINPGRKIDVDVICTPPLPCDVNTQLQGFRNATVNVILRDSVSLNV